MQTNKVSEDLLSKLNDDLKALVTSTISSDELIEKLLYKIVDSPKTLQTKEEIMKMLKIPKQRFEHMVRDGEIPHIYINKKIRLFDGEEIVEFLKKNRKIA